MLAACKILSDPDFIVQYAHLGKAAIVMLLSSLRSFRDLCIQCEGVTSSEDTSEHKADHIMMKVVLAAGCCVAN